MAAQGGSGDAVHLSGEETFGLTSPQEAQEVRQVQNGPLSSACFLGTLGPQSAAWGRWAPKELVPPQRTGADT